MTVNGHKLTDADEHQLWEDFVNSRPKNPWNGEPSLPARKSNCEYQFRRYVKGRVEDSVNDYLNRCDAWGRL